MARRRATKIRTRAKGAEKEKHQPSNDEKEGAGVSRYLSRILNVGACIINPEETLKNSVDRPTMVHEVMTDCESWILRVFRVRNVREAMMENI